MPARRLGVSPPRVVYLGGLGRSGSTIIERLLGELPGVSAVGEVIHLWRRGVSDGERCGCGDPFGKCTFWQDVGKAGFGGWENVDGRYVDGMRKKIDRTRFIPLLATNRLRAADRRLLDEYLSYYLRVYAAVAEVSNAGTVVDSSKSPSLAFCLRWCHDLDLRVVQVVRDPRAVAYSWAKVVSRPDVTGPAPSSDTHMWTYSPPTAAIEWDVQNSAIRLLARLGVSTLLVRYEDFVRAPDMMLSRIASFAGLPPGTTAPFLGSDRAGYWADLPASHSVSGNPMRFSTGRIPIRQDDRWRGAMPLAQRAVVTALTLPLLSRYGYLRGR